MSQSPEREEVEKGSSGVLVDIEAENSMGVVEPAEIPKEVPVGEDDRCGVCFESRQDGENLNEDIKIRNIEFKKCQCQIYLCTKCYSRLTRCPICYHIKKGTYSPDMVEGGEDRRPPYQQDDGDRDEDGMGNENPPQLGACIFTRVIMTFTGIVNVFIFLYLYKNDEPYINPVIDMAFGFGSLFCTCYFGWARRLFCRQCREGFCPAITPVDAVFFIAIIVAMVVMLIYFDSSRLVCYFILADNVVSMIALFSNIPFLTRGL